jgi:hypothetical protein
LERAINPDTASVDDPTIFISMFQFRVSQMTDNKEWTQKSAYENKHEPSI